MLIDTSYFVGQLNIPNTGSVEVKENVGWFIDKYEVQLLRNALGIDLYDEFLTALGASDGSYSNVTNGKLTLTALNQKWVDLLNGKKYIGRDGLRHVWQGFISLYDDAAPKKSIIADYVYYFWTMDSMTQTLGTGEVSANGENATNVFGNHKANFIWTEMCDHVRELVDFLDYSNSSDSNYYPGWGLYGRRRALEHFVKRNSFDI